MTGAMRVRWATIVSVAALSAAAACLGKGKPIDVTDIGFALAGDGGLTDSVEMEVEPDSGPPPALLRSAGPDTVITARQTPGLPKRLDVMSNSEVVHYLNKLAYKRKKKSVQEEWVACTHALDGKPCSAAESAHVFIQPEAGMNKLERGSIPPNGVIVARITNESSGLDAAEFGYKARRKTWWIVDDSMGTLRSRYFVRTYNTTGPAIKFVTYSRPFVLCSHPPTTHPRAARAKFWTCLQSREDTALNLRSARDERSRSGVTANVHLASLRSAVPLPAARPAPLYAVTTNWVSCGAGCCATAP